MSHRFALGQDGREAKIVYEVQDYRGTPGEVIFSSSHPDRYESVECAKVIEPIPGAKRRNVYPLLVWADTGEPVEWEFPL